MTELSRQELAERYVAVWNEPDAESRAKAVGALWADDGVEFTEQSEIRGHTALVDRVAHAYQEFVANQGFSFGLLGAVGGHHDLVRFDVTMAPAGVEPIWQAAVVMLIGEDGRILRDYQIAVS